MMIDFHFILLVTICFLAVQAAEFNSTQYHLGFLAKAGFTQAQTQDAIACAGGSSFPTTVALKFKPIYLATTAEEIADGVVAAIQEANGYASQSQCKNYFITLKSLFWKDLTDLQEIRKVALAQYNSNKAIIDELRTWWSYDLLAGKNYDSGQKATQGFWLLLGIQRGHLNLRRVSV